MYQDKNNERIKADAWRLLGEVEDYAIFLLNRQGIIETWSKGAEMIKGYSAEEVIGKSHRIFYSREDLDAGLPNRLLEEAAARGKANHEGWRIRHDGSRFWGSIHIAAWHDASGAVGGFIKVTRDMTAQKEAEEQAIMGSEQLREANKDLRQSEEKYHRMISEISDYAIISLDKDGVVLDWNKGAERINQYKASEIIGRNFRVFYSREDREAKVPEALLAGATSEGSLHIEGWRIRKDGARIWCAVSIISLRDQQGDVMGFSKVTRDLTERKQAEDKLNASTEALRQTNEALRQSEELFHKMISEVKDYAIILLDTDGKILNWNAGAEQIKGYSTSEAIGLNFRIFYSPDDVQQGLPGALLEEARNKGRASHEGWRIRKDGTRFWGYVVITALHSESGQHIGFSKVTRDLTQQKAAEDELRENALELGRNNRMLLRLNEDLASFNYVASHDLKEPLRKIQTFVSLIERAEGPPQNTAAYLQKIKESASRSYSLIDDLLSFSRVTNDKSRFQMVDLNEVVNRAREEFELPIREKNVRILVDQLPTISGVQFQLQQLFNNLLSNALKFTQARPQIEIVYMLSEYQSPSGTSERTSMYHHISVIDNGIGFDPQYSIKIFDPFQRLDSDRNTAGSGIGLAIVKKVIENHGGWIEAEGRPGIGATFQLYFPAVADIGDISAKTARYLAKPSGVSASN